MFEPQPRLFTVDFVGERLTRGVPRWAVHHVDEDGNGGGHIFPKETLEWRAAEFGLTDVDEILDVILHELHIPEYLDRDDAAARRGLVTSTRPDAEAITLFNAASTTDAWVAHRARITAVKETTALVQPPGSGKNPLDVIRQGHGMTARGIRGKQQLVDVTRWQMVYGDLPVRNILSRQLEVPRA
ncbi:hypothetical protein [Streptomyces spinosirectus]